MPNLSLKKAFCLLGAFVVLVSPPAWATVVTWQMNSAGAQALMKDSERPVAGVTVWNNALPGNTDKQLSFTGASESTAGHAAAFRAAALSDKLQARDTDFQQAAPSTMANLHAVSAFDQQFASVGSFKLAAKALTPGGGSARTMVAYSVGGDPVPVPEMSALFPIVGLIVAVSCTRILRRRRAAQISTSRGLF